MQTPSSTRQTPDISVIMPAFNEGGHIYENIRETLESLIAAGYRTEIVAVDDGSADNTFAEIERAAAGFEAVVAARNPYNMGKGMALRTGFDHARGDTVVFLDADLDLHPSQIHRLMDELESGPYDVVVTSKHHPESRLAYPFARKVASLGYYIIIKLLFGLPVRDTQTGLKVFRREVLDCVFHRLLVKRYAYDVELLATAVRFGYRVHEMPVVLDYKRQVTWGRIRMGDVLSIFADTLAILYRLRFLRYYDMERPRIPEVSRPVLVVTRGMPPTDTVIKRLSLDTNTRIACLGISSENDIGMCGVITFSDDDNLQEWLVGEGADTAVVGFLGPGCTPLGSWVKNALRNFTDESVNAVCGPVVPSPATSSAGQAAAMLYSSVLSAGPNYYLRAITRVRQVGRGSMDNLFLRVSHIRGMAEQGITPFEQAGGMLFDTLACNAIRYDPDVAVSRAVPPLFPPYLRQVFREALDAGRHLPDPCHENRRRWTFAPFAGGLFLVLALTVLPQFLARMALWGYVTAVVFSGLLYFDPLSLILYIPGMVLEHLVRAVAVPLGYLGRIFTRNRQDRPSSAYD